MLDGKEEGFQVTAQRPMEWIAARHVELDIASIGKLNIVSGATEQGELEEELVDNRVRVEKHPLSAIPNADLDKLLAKKRKLEKEISNLQAEYKGKNPEKNVQEGC